MILSTFCPDKLAFLKERKMVEHQESTENLDYIKMGPTSADIVMWKLISNKTLPISETPVPVIMQFSTGAIGSSLAVILLITSRRQHKWHYFYTFFMGLSLTDLSLYFFIYPVATTRYVSKYKWSMPDEYCEFMAFWYVLSVMMTACLICAMSVGRFKTVFFPSLRRHASSNWKQPAAIVLIIWFACAGFSYLQLLHFTSESGGNITQDRIAT